MCVPAAYVQSLCVAAWANMTAANHGENGADTPFVSEGDVMCAWWTRQILSCVPKYPSQTIAINIAFGLRWLLAKDMLPASSACVANAVMYVLAFMPAKEVLNRPLGYVAAALRKALAELGTREQVEAHLALDRTSREKIGNAGLFGDPWMHMVVCTNWTKGNFYDVDFSAAVVKEGRHLGAIWEGTRWRGHPMFNSMPLQSASR